MVGNPRLHFWEASPDLALSTINGGALLRHTVQCRKNELEYTTQCFGIYQSLEFVAPRALCELGRNG